MAYDWCAREDATAVVEPTRKAMTLPAGLVVPAPWVASRGSGVDRRRQKGLRVCDVAFVCVLRHGTQIHPSTGCRCWYYVALAYVAAPLPFRGDLSVSGVPSE
jgi:hypothetical protein